MAKPHLTELSPTHIEVLRRLANGEDHIGIANAMYYSSPNAIQNNMRMIKRILNARNHYHAIYIATKRGLI